MTDSMEPSREDLKIRVRSLDEENGKLEATCEELRKAAEAVLNAEDVLINTKDQKYTPQLTALCKACDGLAKVIGEEGE